MRILRGSLLATSLALLGALFVGCSGDDASSSSDPSAAGASNAGSGSGASGAPAGGQAGQAGADSGGGQAGAGGSTGGAGGAPSGGQAGQGGAAQGGAAGANTAGSASGAAGVSEGGSGGAAGGEVGGAAGQAGGAGGGPVEPPKPTMYENPVLEENGDPACVRVGKFYYLYLPDQVMGGGRVRGFRSSDLVKWESLGTVYDNVDETNGNQKSIGLWAPEVLAYQGKFYLYYASLMSNPLDADVGDKDIVVIESDQPDNFKGGKRTVLLDDQYAFIDPSPFVDKQTGKMFLSYKRRGMKGTGSEIQIRPMKNPTAFDGPAKMVVDSEAVPNSDHTVEQPMLWRQGDVFFLLYSKGHGGGTNYQIAYATASNAMGPYQQQGVLFRSDADLSPPLAQKVISPGASSIVLDGDNQTWMVYRQKKTKEDTFADRFVAIDRVTFKPGSESIEGKPTRGEKRVGPVPLSP